MPDDSVANLWDRIALTEAEDEIIASLKIVLPGIERISFLEYRSSRYRRAAVAKMSGVNEPVPFKSLGDGLNRIFALSVALASISNGILICDEIENGLHYSILPDVWRFIFQTARRLNVQVFATTHSWDCIEAFQQASAEDEADGALIRLQNKNGDVIATVFDEADLAEVTRNGIEVR